MPTPIHRPEVYVGRPGEEIPPELAGGSLLGSPAYAEPFRRLLEDEHPDRTQPDWTFDGRDSATERHLVTPLRSAMRRCGRHFEGFLVEVARGGGDWMGPAIRRGCANEHIAKVYAETAFTKLWEQYRPEKPANVPRREHRRHYSDDTPWTQLSESQRRAIEDAENAA